MRVTIQSILMVLFILSSLNSPDHYLEDSIEAKVSERVPSLDLLIFGNSYTSNNQLTNHIENTLNQAGHNPNVEAKTSGGATLDWHRDQVENNNSDWDISLDEPRDYIILQDQSQVPGFPVNSQYWQNSLSGAQTIDSRNEMKGGDTIFFMTWGYRNGDGNNAFRYPDFPTMQNHLKNGYEMYVENTSTEERPTFIAPVGLAFLQIYEQIEDDGGDPTLDGTSFSNLYSADDSHPSIEGTYLATCVFFATITGDSPVGLSTISGVSDSRAQELQQVAANTVFNETPDYLYPWQFDKKDVTFGVDSGSIFNIDPGATIGLAVNFTNNAEIDTTTMISVSGPENWILNWDKDTTPEVGYSFPAPSDSIQWIDFTIQAPNVSNGIPLANSLHDFSIHLVSDSDASQDWYNFSIRYGVWQGIEIVSAGGNASIDPDGVVNLEVLVKNIGNIVNTLAISMVPLDENNSHVGTPGSSFDNEGWTAIMFNQVNLENMNPNEIASTQVQVKSPDIASGEIKIEFYVTANGLGDPITAIQTVKIVPRSGGDLGLTNINCNFDTIPGDSCFVELFIENTGDSAFEYNLSLVEKPEWLEVNISNQNYFLESGQTIHGIDVENSVAENIQAGASGTVRIQVEVDGWIPAEVTYEITVEAVHSWQVISSDSEVKDGRLIGYWEILNNGNSPDGIVVSVSSNVFTSFGVIHPSSGEGINQQLRSFQILDIPYGDSVLFEVWMDVPEEAPVETEAILTVEIQSFRNPGIVFVDEHRATILGEEIIEPDASTDKSSKITTFLQRWLQTILIVIVSLIGTIGVTFAIRHRIEKDREYYEQQNPKVFVEEPSDWMSKFNGDKEKEIEIIESPTTDLESFRSEFMSKSGTHSRTVKSEIDQEIIEEAQEVLEEAYVEKTISEVIEIADKLDDDDIIHPDNIILDLDDFDERLSNIRNNKRDNEDL